MKNYLSKSAQKIELYKWEDSILEKSLRFDSNTMPFPPPSLSLFLKEMKKRCPINEYTDPNYTKLKNLIADYENVEPNMITVTNSGNEAIDILAKTFLDPGDCFVITPPTYEMFQIQCEINRGNPLEVPLLPDSFALDVEQVIKMAKDKKAKIIFLCHPNNPTGTIIPEEDLEKIIKNSESIVAVDETYREFYGKGAVPLLKKYKNLVILRSFSKFAAIAGARVGYLIAQPIIIERFEGIRFPMGVSFLSYKLAEFVLEKDQEWIRKQIKMIKNERNKLSKKFTNLGFSVYPSQANFLLVRIGKRASEICKKLKIKRIIVRDRSKKKYLEDCIRITVRSPKENDWLLKALKEIV